MPEPWDRLPNETPPAYARFLMYRNLGPRRSLRRAYLHDLRVSDGYTGGVKRLHVPGQWYADCAANFWVDRAAAWDVRNLTAYGARLAVLHTRAVTTIAEKNARHAAKLNPGDDGWTDLIASMKLVAEFLTPDIIRAIQERNKPAGAPVPVGAPADPDE